MCGITGYFGEGDVTGSHFAKMLDSIYHRGPDDSGVFRSAGVALANRRLSIIDIEGGHQPFVSDDGLIAVVQNGEIYNHVELAKELEGTEFRCRSRSDTEVLLRLYEREGISFIEKLNGMFAIAIYDGRTDTSYLVRDRVGVKPLFWSRFGQSILFGSEIKSILASGMPREIDYEALNTFLSMNFVAPPATMFKGIRHVMPGTFMRIKGDAVTEHAWWSLKELLNAPDEGEADKSKFMPLFEDAVRLRMRADVPFGAFLSGGVDSSAVVATMAKQSSSPPSTYCIGFDDQRFDESKYAELLANRVGAKHTTSVVQQNMLDIWPAVTYFNDQPHGDVSFMPTYRVAELAARDVKVVLTGDGGDELFAGYDKYLNFFAANPGALDDRKTFEGQYGDAMRLFDNELQSKLYAGELARSDTNIVNHRLSEMLAGVDSNDGVNLALYLDFMWLLPGNNLVKPDRMGMANSLEARTPFLDYRIVEYAFSLPGNQKLRDGVTKVVLKEAVSDLIGADLAYREKQMFTVPIGEWLKSSSSSLARDVLFDSATVERGFFDSRVIAGLLEDHVEGRGNYTRELRALIALELWCRMFIDGNYDGPPNWSSLGFRNPIAI